MNDYCQLTPYGSLDWHDLNHRQEHLKSWFYLLVTTTFNPVVKPKNSNNMISLYNNRNSLHRIGDRYKRLFDFDHFLGRNAYDETWMTNAGSKIRNGKKFYKIDVALPGLSKKDIHMELHRNMLSFKIIKESQRSDQESGEGPDHIELGRRYYRLPDYVDLDGLKAKLSNGVLKIRIPYKPDYQPNTRIVEVL